jgi:hypothetical protein
MTPPKTIEIDSIDALLHQVSHFGKNIVAAVRLRGQADHTWSLMPSIGRLNHYRYAGATIRRFSSAQEKNMLHKFRRQAAEFADYQRTEWDSLFMARHQPILNHRPQTIPEKDYDLG